MYKTAKGWLTAPEREALFAAAYGGNNILNIGIEYGASLHCFQEGNPNAKIVAVDLIGDEKFEGDRRNIIFLKGDSTQLETGSHTFEVTFIDGGHDYETVKKDIEHFAPITTVLLMFHDYSDADIHAGVKQALDEWHSPDWRKVDQIDTIAIYRRRK